MSVNKNENFDRDRLNRYEHVDVINLDYYEGRGPLADVKNEPWDHLDPPRIPQSSFNSIKPEPSSSLLSESKFLLTTLSTILYGPFINNIFSDNEKIKILTNENSSLRKQLEQFKSYFPTKLAQLQSDKEQFKGYNDILNSTLKRTEDELKIEKRKCEEVTREKKRLEDHLKKCEAFDKAQLIQKNSQLKDALAQVKDDNLGLRKEVKTLTKRLKDAEDHISILSTNRRHEDDRCNETEDDFTSNHTRMVRIKPKERYIDGYQGLEMCEVLDEMTEEGSNEELTEDLNENTEHQEAKFTVTGLIDTSLANCIKVMKNGKSMKRRLKKIEKQRKKKKMKNGRDPRPQSIS